MVVRLGLIGHGAIGKPVLAAVDSGRLAGFSCPAVLVRRPREGGDARLGADPEAFFAHDFDLVVEIAGHEALRAHGERALRRGADLMLTSMGALNDPALAERLEAAAAESGRRLMVLSAGIGSLDILGAAAVGGLDRVQITVRKDPPAWYGTIAEELVDLAALTEPALVYDGPVREGARQYPQNVNISAATALAGIGLDRTRLKIYADPTIQRHRIEIEAEGAFGRYHFVEETVPEPDNPKTGRIVAMAVIKSIRNYAAPMVVGG
jgi:aspartate dehydrogenase